MSPWSSRTIAWKATKNIIELQRWEDCRAQDANTIFIKEKNIENRLKWGPKLAYESSKKQHCISDQRQWPWSNQLVACNRLQAAELDAFHPSKVFEEGSRWNVWSQTINKLRIRSEQWCWSFRINSFINWRIQ